MQVFRLIAKNRLYDAEAASRIVPMTTQDADCVLYNGSIASHGHLDSIAMHRGRIVAIGSQDEVSRVAGKGTKRIDLRGRPVVPGFVDAHVHLLSTGLCELGWRLDLSGLSRDGTLAALAETAAERGEGEWVIGVGWDESNWRDSRYLTRRELDRLAPNSPVGAARRDGHLLVVNSAALRMIGEDILSHDQKDDIDEPKGELRETAAWTVLEAIEPDRSTLAAALSAAARRCHQLGVTTVHTMSPSQRVSILLENRGRNCLRVVVYQRARRLVDLAEPSPQEGDFDDEWVRFGGVKIFADGSIGATNAAVREPFRSGGSGVLTHDDATLSELIRRADDAGCQTAIHAIGDRAIEQVLRVHSAVGTSPALRHRIEHLELPTKEQIDRTKRLGLCASMQPNFIGNWSGSGSLYERQLGPARDASSNPLRWIIDAGVPLAFGSDGMPVSPLYGLHCAVNAPHPVQRLTVAEAIARYTSGGAYHAFEENVKGRIDVGAYADLVVLDEDPSQAPERLNERRVEMTFVGGECVYLSEKETDERSKGEGE